jgi:adenosylcobinamide kinase / adenosylcobinamide-phosphate guanylyltransferase
VPIVSPIRTLIVGGARSGKSRFAEGLAGDGPVRYVAPGYPPGDDAEWAARVAAHQARRPGHWQTVETTDVAGAVLAAGADEVVLVDCLATWLTRVLDGAGAWSEEAGWPDRVAAQTDRLVAAWPGTVASVVAVSNEVGLGVVPATWSGRLFRDQLGTLNQRIGALSDRLYLVIAGRVLDLSDAPVVGHRD